MQFSKGFFVKGIQLAFAIDDNMLNSAVVVNEQILKHGR
jgi:hypothetical protein